MPPLGAENSCKREQRTNLFGLCQVQPNLEKLNKSSFDDFFGGLDNEKRSYAPVASAMAADFY